MDSVIHLSHMQLGPLKYCVVSWIDIILCSGYKHYPLFKQLQEPWPQALLKEMRLFEERDHVHVDHKEFLLLLQNTHFLKLLLIV